MKTLVEPWCIRRESEVDNYCQSVFCLANGNLGVRGFCAQERKNTPYAHGIFHAGLFEYIKPGITDMVQLPDMLTFRLCGAEPMVIEQRLDMRSGILTHRWETERVAVTLQRAVSMADNQLILQRISLTAKVAGDFTVEQVTDTNVRNRSVHDDQMANESESVRLLFTDECSTDGVALHTEPSGRKVRITDTVSENMDAVSTVRRMETCVITRLSARLVEGRTWTINQQVRVLVDDEVANAAQDKPWQVHRRAWETLWRGCDIELDADGALQGAVRYAVFQLLCNQSYGNPAVSIGARGLTHGRYKGNTFWDTEIFMLPFFLWTRPKAAKDLLTYRTDRLEDAKALAKAQSLSGAKYPWMCAQNGTEQCETWDTGLCEVHVTADVVYAMQKYVDVTGDAAFLRSQCAEVYRQTALYWQSRLTWEEARQQYSSFFVKGPDEYCGTTVNNTYTNYMARHNIRLALRYGRLTKREQVSLLYVERHIALLYDPVRDLFLQDELLERLEPAPFAHTDGEPTYRRISFDRMQRYRLLKQADLVQLIALFPDDFTEEQKRAIFNTYEPITVHDSSLSYGVHAQVALQLTIPKKAEDYLQKAAFLDLYDLLGNTGTEGIHLAASGALWQAVVFGAAGVSLGREGNLVVNPHLPSCIRGMRCMVCVRGKRYRIEIGSDEKVKISEVYRLAKIRTKRLSCSAKSMPRNHRKGKA
jgi:kojibiose phosphorylase